MSRLKVLITYKAFLMASPLPWHCIPMTETLEHVSSP